MGCGRQDPVLSLPPQIELLHPVAQRVPSDAQKRRRTRDIAAGPRQRTPQRLDLDITKGGAAFLGKRFSAATLIASVFFAILKPVISLYLIRKL